MIDYKKKYLKYKNKYLKLSGGDEKITKDFFNNMPDIDKPIFSKCDFKKMSKPTLFETLFETLFHKKKDIDIGRKLTDFIARKGDICCIDNHQKEKAIKVLYEKYQYYYGDEYLNQLNNNISLLIPKKVCEYNDNEKEDKEGIEIEKILDDKMLKNKKVDKDKLTALLNELPLYFILTLIGSEIVVNAKINIQPFELIN